MRPSQALERAREKVQEVAEKTGYVVGKGLTEGWGKAKGLGEDLKKELLRLHRKTMENKKRARSRRRKNQLRKR